MIASGIVLCGGRGSRVGGADKGLITRDGSTLVAGVINRLQEQVNEILISANRNLEQYRELGFPVIADQLADYQGPLAGIATTLPHCACENVVIVPCDSPRFPETLVERLLAPLQDPQIQLSVADDGQRRQYLFCAMRQSCLKSLEEYLQGGGRSVKGWQEQLHIMPVDFSDCPDAFTNLNTSEDFQD